jgi:glycolate oxidase iron-sulfur subunit
MCFGCCGLLSYNYSEIADARILAKKAIEGAEAAEADEAPVVGDCSSCVAFLKTYPQLFLDDPEWKRRAEKFSSRVKDVVEVLDQTEAAPARQQAGPVVYHESCRACHGQGVKPPNALLEGLCGADLRPLSESEVCCGGAGAFSFLHPELSDEVLRRKIGCIASAQARVVVTSSTSCLVQLAHGLKKYYPDCRVLHLSEFVARGLLPADDGKTTRA